MSFINIITISIWTKYNVASMEKNTLNAIKKSYLYICIILESILKIAKLYITHILYITFSFAMMGRE